jgi:beta-1,2-xylosyltransferase
LTDITSNRLDCRLLATNSLILKSTIYPEWYSTALIPWFHYVPVKSSYADLLDILAFFRGPPHDPLNPFTSAHSTLSKGEEHPGFDEVAQAIARNGQCFVRRMWRREDLQAYMFLVWLEMGRLLSGDRSGMVSRIELDRL